MSTPWAEQYRRDLLRAQTDLEECRREITRLRLAKDKALELLKRCYPIVDAYDQGRLIRCGKEASVLVKELPMVIKELEKVE
jgi:hypothetical protein